MPFPEVLTWYRMIWERFALHALDVSAMICGNREIFQRCAFRSALRTAFAVRRQAAGPRGGCRAENEAPLRFRTVRRMVRPAAPCAQQRCAQKSQSAPCGFIYDRRPYRCAVCTAAACTVFPCLQTSATLKRLDAAASRLYRDGETMHRIFFSCSITHYALRIDSHSTLSKGGSSWSFRVYPFYSSFCRRF